MPIGSAAKILQFLARNRTFIVNFMALERGRGADRRRGGKFLKFLVDFKEKLHKNFDKFSIFQNQLY